MQAIKELANRLDGRPAQILDLSGPDGNPITKIVNEIVHVYESPEEISASDEPVLIEWRGVRDCASQSPAADRRVARPVPGKVGFRLCDGGSIPVMGVKIGGTTPKIRLGIQWNVSAKWDSLCA
jgi:hypothetical protein